MILIADSGSTKCTWILDSPGETRRIRTIGINAIQHTREQIRSVLEQLPALGGVESVYFYGAGCGPALPEASEKLRSELASKFPKADVHVESDLQAAALALYGRGEGIACILGTGANSCHCRRGEILQNVPPLGYVLGDEGSGSWIGRSLLSDYIKQIMPERLRKVFYRQYGLDYAGIVEHVYSDRHPNRFLASFALFAAENRDDPYVDALIEAGFDLFFRRNILNYPFPWKLRAAGSVAYGFSDKLKTVSMRYGVDTDMIVDSPMEGLVGYHLAKLRRNV